MGSRTAWAHSPGGKASKRLSPSALDRWSNTALNRSKVALAFRPVERIFRTRNISARAEMQRAQTPWIKPALTTSDSIKGIAFRECTRREDDLPQCTIRKRHTHLPNRLDGSV
ncbi:hypothetical protein [Occallatibacter savannae]|uniref:hypothetical protein n=1 Tax=Occallatibacter savannae TaxID=1002691 RepID=UPI000D6931E1|nr:hypothetical protein [Occallatibacter savannae]